MGILILLAGVPALASLVLLRSRAGLILQLVLLGLPIAAFLLALNLPFGISQWGSVALAVVASLFGTGLLLLREYQPRLLSVGFLALFLVHFGIVIPALPPRSPCGREHLSRRVHVPDHFLGSPSHDPAVGVD